MLSLSLRKLGMAPLPVAGFLTFLFAVLGIGEGLAYSSVFLEVGLNVFLILGAAVIVAWISVKSFLSTGAVNVLLLGTAVLAFGTMATLGGAVSSVDASEGIAVYSMGGLIAGGLHLASSILTYHGGPRRTVRLKLRAGAAYLGVIGFLTLVSLLAIGDKIPPDFGVPGSIPERAAAGITVLLLTVSAVLFSRVYLRSRNPILYWYSLALWATAVGFLAFFGKNGNGDLLLWTGIGSICIGSIYFLLSIHSVPRLRGGGATMGGSG